VKGSLAQAQFSIRNSPIKFELYLTIGLTVLSQTT